MRYTFKGDADARSADHQWRQLPILSKAFYTAHPFEQTTLEPPLGSGPYKIDDFQARNIRQLQAPRRLLGQGSAGEPRPLQFRRVALRVLSRSHRRAREHAVGRLSISARNSHPGTGRRPTTSPAVREGRILRLTMPGREPFRCAGFLHQYAAREVRGPARARGARSRVRLRVDEQKPVFRALQAHCQLLRKLGHEGHWPADARANWRCWNRSATSCRPRCSASPTRPRSPTARGKTGQAARRRATCWPRPAGT